MKKQVEVPVTWRPSTEIPPKDADEVMRPRTLLVILHESEWRSDSRTVNFGRYVHALKTWRIDGSPSDWEVAWWAELPEVPHA